MGKHRMQQTRRRRGRVAFLGVAVLATAAAGSYIAPTGALGSGSSLVMQSPGWSFLGEQTMGSGVVVDQWQNGSTILGVAAPAGGTVSIDTLVAGGVSTADVTVGQTLDKTATATSTSPGVLTELEALGMSAQDAQTQFGTFAASVPQVDTPNTADVAKAVDLAGRTPYETPCFTINADGGRIHAYGCDRQYIDSQHGGDWYLADEMQESGISKDTATFGPDHLTDLKIAVKYGTNNQLIKWAPGSSKPTGSCTTETSGVQSSQTGLTYTSASTVCPDYYGPWVVDSLDFGSGWHGYENITGPNGEWESTNAADMFHSPYNASADVYVHGVVSWCSYC